MPRALLVILAGCGRVGFDALGGPGASGDGGDGGDADARIPDGPRVPYRQAVMDDAPRAYFRLDDTGTTAVDETNRYVGTYSGGCTRGLAGLLANDPSTAVRFDGVNCRIDITGDLAFNGQAPFSVEVWARQESVATFQTFFMNEIRQGANPRDGYAQQVNQVGSIPVIGSYPPASGDVPLHGFIDEVAIYDKALPADRVAVHYAIGHVGP